MAGYKAVSNLPDICINLPYDAADTIYKNVELGTPVVAYYRENVKLTSNNAKVSNAYSYSSK